MTSFSAKKQKSKKAKKIKVSGFLAIKLKTQFLFRGRNQISICRFQLRDTSKFHSKVLQRGNAEIFHRVEKEYRSRRGKKTETLKRNDFPRLDRETRDVKNFYLRSASACLTHLVTIRGAAPERSRTVSARETGRARTRRDAVALERGLRLSINVSVANFAIGISIDWDICSRCAALCALFALM